MSRNASCDELRVGSDRLYRLWLFSTRYIAPVAVILVFLNAIGALDWLS